MKYGILLIGEERTYVIFECKTIEELTKRFNEETLVFTAQKLRAVKFLHAVLNIDDGFDNAVIGGVER